MEIYRNFTTVTMILSPHGPLIDADHMLLSKFPEPGNDYQHGWNDALQAARDNEPVLIPESEEDPDYDTVHEG